MKKLCPKLMLIVLFVIPLINSCSHGNKGKWTKEEATKWFKSGAWRNGLKMKVHPSVNLIEFAEQFHKNKEVWEKVFSFLNQKYLDTLLPGNYPIDGTNAYAFVQEYIPKDFSESIWESHRKYIDLQCVLHGDEKIGIALVKDAEVIKPYDDSTDVANYRASGKFYVAHPDTIFLFFPHEAHRPSIKADWDGKVRKLVIKIKER